MLQTRSFRWFSLPVLLCSSVLLQWGCSYAPVEPDSGEILVGTGSLISDVEYGMEIVDPVHLIRYTNDPAVEEVRLFNQHWKTLRSGLRDLLSYSYALTEIEDSASDQTGIEMLADNLENLFTRLRSQPLLKDSLAAFDIDTQVAQIRAQKELLSAAKLSLPAIDAVVDSLSVLMLDTGQLAYTASDDLYERIVDYHADVTRYQQAIHSGRGETIRQLEMLDRVAATGDIEAWEQLRNSGLVARSELAGYAEPSAEAYARAEAVLLERLAKLDKVSSSLDPEFKLYQAEVIELREIRNSVFQSLGVVQIALDAWETSHELFVLGKRSTFAEFTTDLMVIAARKSAGRLL